MKPGASRRAASPTPLSRARTQDDYPTVWLLLVSLLLLWSAGAAAAGRTPAELLARMAEALRTLNYEGRIVYLHQNKLELLHILHRVEDGQVREQLLSLNGPVRVMNREKGHVICALSDSHPISVRGQDVGRQVLRAWALHPQGLDAHYLLHVLGADRVAGRQTEVVGILPRDDLRYGYRFYLDAETGLPLKSDLFGKSSDPIEQIMFATLELLPAEATDQRAAAFDTGGASAAAAPDLAALPWRFESLPPGFVLALHDDLDGGGQRVEHFLLTDGLASVSVYIESDSEEGLKGNAYIGAVHAAGKRVAGHQVTVVGEVPLQTVETVLAGVRYVDGGQR